MKTQTYSTQEVAELLGVTDGRIRQIARDPRHAGMFTRHGRDWRFTDADVAKLREIRES